jgi:alpha-1,3-glucosyltransferase
VTGSIEARGYAEASYVTLMRALVVVLEFMIFVPGYLKLLNAFLDKESLSKYKYILLFGVLNVPPMVFVDHGHFQFNQVMHGLVLWAIAFILEEKVEFAVVAMVLAINFKQMALYFALPFGVFALAILIRQEKKE